VPRFPPGARRKVEAIREPSARATATTNLATGLGRLLAGRLNLLIYRNFLKRMMGLEPTTFCMAKLAGVRARSPEFAETSCLQRLRSGERTGANPSEPERTPSAAIAAIVIAATFELAWPGGATPPERPSLSSASGGSARQRG
jgi:hypothetical protein